MSLIKQEEPTEPSKAIVVKNRPQIRLRKVIEEDEYLGRMARIIKRDFFLNPCANDALNTPTTTYIDSERSHQTYSTETPGTDRTDLTATSSVRSRRADKSMRLNEFLEKHTSEDNAYFDKLQRRDLRRHRAKFPWLYTDRNNHNKQVHDQLQLGSAANKSIQQGSEQSQAKMIDWHYNPKNALFYPPSDAKAQSSSSSSTVNYESNKYGYEPKFKEPLPVRPSGHVRGLDRFADKIGIDGKLLNGSETPTVGGYAFIPPPETPPRIDDTPKPKRPANRYFIPSESPRDDLAHRLYEDKVAKKIRTPRSSTRSDSKKTPKSTLQRMF